MIQIVHVNIFYHKKLQKMFHVPRSCISYDTCSILFKIVFNIQDFTTKLPPYLLLQTEWVIYNIK